MVRRLLTLNGCNPSNTYVKHCFVSLFTRSLLLSLKQSVNRFLVALLHFKPMLPIVQFLDAFLNRGLDHPPFAPPMLLPLPLSLRPQPLLPSASLPPFTSATVTHPLPTHPLPLPSRPTPFPRLSNITLHRVSETSDALDSSGYLSSIFFLDVRSKSVHMFRRHVQLEVLQKLFRCEAFPLDPLRLALRLVLTELCLGIRQLRCHLPILCPAFYVRKASGSSVDLGQFKRNGSDGRR